MDYMLMGKLPAELASCLFFILLKIHMYMNFAKCEFFE